MTSYRRRWVLLGLTGFALLALAHQRFTAGGMAYRGLLRPLDHLYNVVLVLAFLLLCLGVGDRLVRSLGVGDLEPVDRMLFGLISGAGIVATAVLAAGLLGLLSPFPLLGILGLAAWWGREGLANASRFLKRAARSIPRSVVILGCLVGTVLLVRAVMPVTDWDSLMYHLHLPREFLEHGRLFAPPDTLHVAYTGLAHMLYVPLLAFGSPTAPPLLMLALALLLPVAVWRFAERLFGATAGELSGLAIWGTGTIALVAVTARVDVSLSLVLVVAHFALYDALAGERRPRRVLMAGILLGVAMAVKYQAVAYAIALSPMVVWSASRSGASEGAAWRDVFLLGVVSTLVVAPWFAKNWYLLDAPFYPFLSPPLLPPWLADLYGARVLPDSVDPGVFGGLADVRRPFDIIDAFVRPDRLSVEEEAAHYHLSPFLLLVPACALWARDRRLAWLMVPAIGYLVLVLLSSPTTNLRYLLPALPALTVAAAAIAKRILAAVETGITLLAGEGEAAAEGPRGLGPVARYIGIGVVILSLLPAAAAVRSWLPPEVTVQQLTGEQSRLAYLSARRNPASVIRAGLTDFGERDVPEDARVLMLFEAREFYVMVPAVQDPVLANWAFLGPALPPSGCLEATGLTHVLVNTAVLEYYFRRGLDPETVGWPSFRDFAARCLERATDVPGYRLYRAGAEAAPRMSK